MPGSPAPRPPAVSASATATAEDESSLVPAAGRFSGLVAFRGRARIDGELQGDVRAEGTLLLGPAARLEGRVEVDELIVAGALEGDVRARSRIELVATARVRGTLETPLLVMAEGSILEGRCSAGTAERTGPDPPGSASATG